jgi:hypothetical protein
MRYPRVLPGDRGSLLATTAGAQNVLRAGWRPIDPYYENDTFAEWPQEAQRFKTMPSWCRGNATACG